MEGAAFYVDKKRRAADDARATGPAAARARALSKERELERLVFGRDDEFEAKLGRELDDDDDDADADGDSVEGDGTEAARAEHGGRAAGRAAWVDEDDESVAVDLTKASRTKKLRRSEKEAVVSGSVYEQRLREQFERAHGSVAWARRRARKGAGAADGGKDGATERADDDDDDDDELSAAEDEDEGALGAALRTTRPLVHKPALTATEVRVSRACDANASERSEAVVQAIDFHPTNDLFLTAGERARARAGAPAPCAAPRVRQGRHRSHAVGCARARARARARAGFDRTLRLFRIDGTDNPKVQGVFLQDCPMSSAAFSADGRQVVAAGRARHFYAVDLGAGSVSKVPPLRGRKERSLSGLVLSADGEWLAFAGEKGAVLLVSARTKQLVTPLQMNRSGAALAFGPNGHLWSAGKAGEAYLWDVRSSRCVCRFVDEGMSETTALAASPDGSRLAVGARRLTPARAQRCPRPPSGGPRLTPARRACAAARAAGSASGVVNVYDARSLLSLDGPARPLKSILNLSTAITSLQYNHDSQLLAIGSRQKRNALRLMHGPSLGVYRNWPTAKTPLRHVQCCAFSAASQYFASGNDAGAVLLYRVHHYSDAPARAVVA